MDTNALHYALLFLELAREHGLAPFGESIENVETLIQEKFRGRKAVESITTGRGVVSYLGDQCDPERDDPAVALYSPVSRLELASGLLRGRAVENAAQGGLPRRWSSVPDEEVRSWLSGEDYGWAHARTSDLESMFEKAGVDLHESERALEPEAWRLADRILQHVFMGWADALILSCAVLEEAHEVLTSDSHVRRVVNRLSNPHDEPSAQAREQYRLLRDAVRAFVSRGRPLQTVKLPRPTPKNALKLPSR